MTDVIRPQYFPAGIYSDKNAQCELKDKVFFAAGATNNQAVITAVSGKRLYIVSMNIYTSGIATDVVFKSASGGTNKYACQIPANTVATPNFTLGFKPDGWFNTETGEGLYVDVIAAVQTNISVRYIEYTP